MAAGAFDFLDDARGELILKTSHEVASFPEDAAVPSTYDGR
jgi:hypothetical protein